ncbi:MAG: hypothetical protein IPM38_04410 [Ignavibacteria bacterium]|nr:hypothetical protein [Ignavibacteria bacterium]
MKQHFVYFYGSTKIISGHNSQNEESIRKRNQIIGYEGIDVNPELVEYGEICFNKVNNDGSKGETGTMFPKNITIVPFRYINNEDLRVRNLEDVITANEYYIKAESIGFPFMMLKSATNEGYSNLGKGNDLPFVKEIEIDFKNKWCCFGHYYLYLLKKALYNKGYSSNEVTPEDKIGNLNNELFIKTDGTKLVIHANAGL